MGVFDLYIKALASVQQPFDFANYRRLCCKLYDKRMRMG